MADFVFIAAKKIPESIRRHIIEEGFIDSARNVFEVNSAMEYLFDVYMEFIDISGEHDDFTCFKCREHVLDEWHKMKSYLIKMESGV